MSNAVKRCYPHLGEDDGSARAAWSRLGGCLIVLLALATLLPAPADLIRPKAARDQPSSAALDDAVLIVAGLVVWGLLVWLLLIAGCAAVASVPGTVGLTARRLLERIAPAAAGRLVAATLGVAALGGVAGCSLPAWGTDDTPGTTAPSISIDWPQIDASTSTILGGPSDSADPAPTVVNPSPAATSAPAQTVLPPPPGSTSGAASADPTSTNPTSADPASHAATAPSTPTSSPSAAGGAAPESAAPSVGHPAPRPAISAPEVAESAPDAPTSSPQASAPGVLVQPGDSLWCIASRALPGASDERVDAEWRRWYAANRDVVGTDPDLILPGQLLQPPNDAVGRP